MTDTRIDALRTHIASLHKALKMKYANAQKPDATRRMREEANQLVKAFQDELNKVEEELRTSTKATENVQFGVESLEAELSAYKGTAVPKFPHLPVLESEESTRDVAREGMSELNGRGEARAESFPLPQSRRQRQGCQ